MSNRLIAVLRRPQVLVGLTSVVRPDGHGYRIEHKLSPLSAIPESICPWRDRDLKAWRALGNVPRISRRAGKAIVRAVIGSVADPEHRPALDGPLDWGTPPRDLRPHLCTPEGEQSILENLARATGDSLSQISDDTGFPDWHWYHRLPLAELPAEFQRLFLWGLHLAPWAAVVEIAEIYSEFDLEKQTELRHAAAHLLSASGPKAFIHWANAVEDRSPQEQIQAAFVCIANLRPGGAKPGTRSVA